MDTTNKIGHALANLTCSMGNEMCCALNGLMWCGQDDVPCCQQFDEVYPDIVEIIGTIVEEEKINDKFVCSSADWLLTLGGRDSTLGDTYEDAIYTTTTYEAAYASLKKVNEVISTASEIECAVAKQLCIAANAISTCGEEAASAIGADPCIALSGSMVSIVDTVAIGDVCASGVLYMANALLNEATTNWNPSQTAPVYSLIEGTVDSVSAFKNATSQKLCTAMTILCDGCEDAELNCSKDGSGKGDCSAKCAGCN